MPSSDINLDLSALVQQPFALSSVGSAPNMYKDKYPVAEIKDPTPCTLMYVKGRTSRTIKVAEATVMPSRILHGRPVPAECAVVEVTTIREVCEFEDLDYPDEDEEIEKLVDAKGTFILWPCKDIIVKTHSSPFVSPWNTKARGHSYIKHAEACSNLPSISDSSSRSKLSRPRALVEHGEKADFSSERVSNPRAPGQQGV
jgi:hypothetical protein